LVFFYLSIIERGGLLATDGIDRRALSAI